MTIRPEAVAPVEYWAVAEVLQQMRLHQSYNYHDIAAADDRSANTVVRLVREMARWHVELQELRKPVELILHCPVCHRQHQEEEGCSAFSGRCCSGHVSHICSGCGCEWRPMERPSLGVARLEAHGEADSWPAIGRKASPVVLAGVVAGAAGAGIRPENCRDRLRAEGKAYARSGCGGCNPKNKHRFTCPFEGD